MQSCRLPMIPVDAMQGGEARQTAGRSESMDMTETQLRNLLFVARCAGAAMVAIWLAGTLGLPHPVWAAMSAIIVSQDRIGDTRQVTVGRLLGTLLGVVIAVLVGTAARAVGIGTTAEIGIAVAIAAIAARRWPSIRVCMWTCPIVFVMVTPGTPILDVGLYRGAEVLLGGAIGFVLHLLCEAILTRFLARKPT